MRIRSIICLGVVLAGCGLHAAFSEEIVTDRPDATESSSVVQPGYVQVELGWLHSKNGGAEIDQVPQTLIRIGLDERMEARLGWVGYVNGHASASAEGIGDGELGAKLYLAEENGLMPETALLGSITLPWGDSDVSNDDIDPDIRLCFSHTLSETFSLGYNLGAEWDTDHDLEPRSFVYTVALGAALTDSLGAYVESFGDIGIGASDDTHSLDGGFTYLLQENLQLDILGGFGLSDDADDWFVGTGISYRYPN